MLIYFRKQKLIFVILALAVIAGGAAFGFRSIHTDTLETIPVLQESKPLENTALVRLFIDAIQEQSNLFYEPYYTVNPTIVDYWTTVKSIEENGPQIYVTFSTLPYIGPHDTIGEDEITFSINRSGEIAMVDFKHLKSYSLPDNLKSIEKGALPPVSVKEYSQ